jgi:nucleoid DNA-binding protein
MSPSEKKLLQEAAYVIKRELMEKGEVTIRGLGKFYTTPVSVYAGVHPMADDELFDRGKIESRTSVRFRTYRSFFKKLNPEAR